MIDNKQILIANSFEKLCLKEGYKKATLGKIADELSISKKTIYKYFASKEDVYDFLVKRQSLKLEENILRAINKTSDDWQKLKIIINICIKRIKNYVFINKDYKNTNFEYPYDIAFTAFKYTIDKLIKKIIVEGNRKGMFQIKNTNLTVKFIEVILLNCGDIITQKLSDNIEEELYENISKLLKSDYAY